MRSSAPETFSAARQAATAAIAVRRTAWRRPISGRNRMLRYSPPWGEKKLCPPRPRPADCAWAISTSPSGAPFSARARRAAFVPGKRSTTSTRKALAASGASSAVTAAALSTSAAGERCSRGWSPPPPGCSRPAGRRRFPDSCAALRPQLAAPAPARKCIYPGQRPARPARPLLPWRSSPFSPTVTQYSAVDDQMSTRHTKTG